MSGSHLHHQRVVFLYHKRFPRLWLTKLKSEKHVLKIANMKDNNNIKFLLIEFLTLPSSYYKDFAYEYTNQLNYGFKKFFNGYIDRDAVENAIYEKRRNEEKEEEKNVMLNNEEIKQKDNLEVRDIFQTIINSNENVISALKKIPKLSFGHLSGRNNFFLHLINYVNEDYIKDFMNKFLENTDENYHYTDYFTLYKEENGLTLDKDRKEDGKYKKIFETTGTCDLLKNKVPARKPAHTSPTLGRQMFFPKVEFGLNDRSGYEATCVLTLPAHPKST